MARALTAEAGGALLPAQWSAARTVSGITAMAGLSPALAAMKL